MYVNDTTDRKPLPLSHVVARHGSDTTKRKLVAEKNGLAVLMFVIVAFKVIVKLSGTRLVLKYQFRSMFI